MNVASLIKSLLAVTGFVLAIWFIGYLMGFQIALISTLVLSLVLTLIINVAMMFFNRGRVA